MKTKNIFIGAFLSLITILNAQTSVPGGIVSGNWTLSGSPYLVQGSIQIPLGSTLTIAPGVRVEFQGTYKFLVQGQLIALGTSVDTITFTATNKSTGWRSIRFDNTNPSNDTSRLSYCRIKYGKATGSTPDDNGGGVYFSNFSKAVISNCKIDSCMANTNGGGIYCSNSNPRIFDNAIERDTAKYGAGGGIYTSGCDLFLYNNTVSNNVVSQSSVNSDGGGMYIGGGNVVISNNTISGNFAYNNGSGLYNYANISEVSGNIISNNSTPGSGGGMFINYGTHQIDDNLISGNTANRGGGIATYAAPSITNNIITNNAAVFSMGNEGAGGGIYLFNASPVISNNVICNNEASSSNGTGGAIHCNGSSPSITNCTMANNSAPKGGGIYCMITSNPVFRNVILWGNTASSVGPQVALDDEPSDPSFFYCDVEGASAAFDVNGNFYTGTYTSNLNSNPFFISPSGGSGIGFNGTTANWALQSSSPCVDAGDPSGTYPSTDVAGNPRVSGSFIDIGAYEYQGGISIGENLPNGVSLYPNPASQSVNLFVSGVGTADVLIYNQVGQLVKEQNVISGTSNIVIESLPNGIYSVMVRTPHKLHHRKLVVNK